MQPKPSRRVWMWSAAAALVVLCGILWVWLFRAQPNTTLPREAGAQTVLVLYFENQSRTPALDWLLEGLADMLIDDLSRSPKVNVFSREQVAALARRVGWQTQTAPRLEEAMAMASHAHAQVLLLGKFGKFGGEVRMTVQLHRARDGSLMRTETATARRLSRHHGHF